MIMTMITTVSMITFMMTLVLLLLIMIDKKREMKRNRYVNTCLDKIIEKLNILNKKIGSE